MLMTICGSLKCFEKMLEIKNELERLGYKIFMPIRLDTVDYWSEDNVSRVKAKKELGLILAHRKKIMESDAIVVVNCTQGDIQHYIGANTFLEIGFAYAEGIPVYLLNPLPEQPYILDELLAMHPIILNGHVEDIGKINANNLSR